MSKTLWKLVLFQPFLQHCAWSLCGCGPGWAQAGVCFVEGKISKLVCMTISNTCVSHSAGKRKDVVMVCDIYNGVASPSIDSAVILCCALIRSAMWLDGNWIFRFVILLWVWLVSLLASIEYAVSIGHHVEVDSTTWRSTHAAQQNRTQKDRRNIQEQTRVWMHAYAYIHTRHRTKLQHTCMHDMKKCVHAWHKGQKEHKK